MEIHYRGGEQLPLTKTNFFLSADLYKRKREIVLHGFGLTKTGFLVGFVDKTRQVIAEGEGFD